MQSNKLLLLSSTVMPLVLVAGVAGVAVGGAAIAAGLGAATARAQCAPKAANPCAAKPCAPNPCAAAKADPCAAANPCAVKKVAACAPCNPCAAANPCNPCAAANPCNPCGPCAAAGGASSNCVVPRLQTAAANPCAAKKVSACAPGNPCNAAKAAANPCNPCAATKAAANPCNPCAVVKAAACAPCNPCAAAKAAAGPCNPCNPCAAANPCNPCAAAGPCNPCGASAAAELTDEEAVAVYDCLLEELAAAYAKSGNAVALNYQSWPRYSSQPYTSATHGERYVQNYANPKGRAYGAYEDAGRMPAGTALAKDSFTVDAQGRASVGPLFVMEKMDAGFNPESDDWRYTMIMPSGAVFGTTKGQGSDNVAFCIGCHMGVSQADSMLFMPEDYRVRR